MPGVRANVEEKRSGPWEALNERVRKVGGERDGEAKIGTGGALELHGFVAAAATFLHVEVDSGRGGDDLATERDLSERKPTLVNCNFAYRTRLHFAVREGRLDATAYLLTHGADAVNIVIGYGFVRMALERRHDALVRLLEARLRDHFGICPEGETTAAALRGGLWAVPLRRIDWVDALLERGPGLETQATTIFEGGAMSAPIRLRRQKRSI